MIHRGSPGAVEAGNLLADKPVQAVPGLVEFERQNSRAAWASMISASRPFCRPFLSVLNDSIGSSWKTGLYETEKIVSRRKTSVLSSVDRDIGPGRPTVPSKSFDE